MAIAMISVVGSYIRYVKPSLLPWLLAAAVVLIGLALTCIVCDVRGGGPQHGDDSQSHRHHPAIAWLLVAPIAVLIFVVPPALSARAAAPSVVAVSTDVLRPHPPRWAGSAGSRRLFREHLDRGPGRRDSRTPR